MAGNDKYQLNFWKEAKVEYAKLDGSQLIFVKKGLKRIKVFGLNCGNPLHGNLEGYRKLKNRKLGLRIIFGQDPQTKNIQIIDIIAIRKRRRSEVYNNAFSRVQKCKKD